MEILIGIVVIVAAWRFWVWRLKKKAHTAYSTMAENLGPEGARHEFDRVFSILLNDARGERRLPPAEGLHFFDWGTFLLDYIERNEGHLSKSPLSTPAAETELLQVAHRLRERLRQVINRGISGADVSATSSNTMTTEDPSPPRDAGQQVVEISLSDPSSITSARMPKLLKFTRVTDANFNSYRISLYKDVVFDNTQECPHVMVAFDQTAKCRLIVDAELNSSPRAVDQRSHFLCAWIDSQRYNFGARAEFGEFDTFVQYAMLVLARYLVIPEETTPKDESPTISSGAKISLEIGHALERSPTVSMVRTYGGELALQSVRRDAANYISRRIAEDQDLSLGAMADEAVKVAIHGWYRQNMDLLPSGEFMKYLDSLEHRR